MAAVAASPQIIRNRHLRYGGVDVELPEGTSFWARTDEGNERKIEVNLCSKAPYHTSFALVLPTRQAYHDAIKELLAAKVRPNRMFYVEQIQISDDLESIRLNLITAPNVENFLVHMSENCRQYGFNATPAEREVVLVDQGFESTWTQVERINNLFQSIIAKMGDGNINEALANMKDARFPGEQRECGGVYMSALDALDLQREYELSPEGAADVIHLGGGEIKATVTAGEIYAWMADPKSFQGRQVEKYLASIPSAEIRDFVPEFLYEDERFAEPYKRFLENAIRSAQREEVIDGEKLGNLLIEAQKMKMNITELLYKVAS